MEKYEHLRISSITKNNMERKKKRGFGIYNLPENRDKSEFVKRIERETEEITHSFAELQNRFPSYLNPSLIFEIKLNHSTSYDGFENELTRMGIHVLAVAENRQDYWVVFANNIEATEFKRKLSCYGQPDSKKYEFFNIIESFQDIPAAKKIGKLLQEKPLSETVEFIDVELWHMIDQQKNKQFITNLKQVYRNQPLFRITDQLITKSFVLLRVKLTKAIFDEIIELKEVARADRPSIMQFNPFEYYSPNVSEIEINTPDENAVGILIIDSGIISNHPMLEKCVGGEESFQEGERETHDTVGHGMAVAGCAAYGDIESCLKNKEFTPSNWIFSAKVMYAENNSDGTVFAEYDPEKLIEHQFKDAVESFLSNPDYHIRVVNISLGNSNEVWHKNYSRQLPLAAFIDELAFTFPDVVFIVSAGNQYPSGTIADIKDNYPAYLTENPDFKIINPATAALALTIGSIAGEVRIERERYGAEQIKTPIAEENQPSPFTRTGNGINGMIKPELVEYGGNLILSENHGRIVEDRGGKIILLNNKAIGDIIKLDYGTSFSASKVAHLAGRIANQFPEHSGLFIKNMLLMSASYPFIPSKDFYLTKDKKEAETKHLSICGFGLSNFDRAVNSYSNRTVLWDESEIGLDKIKVYSLKLPDIFFTEKGRKRIIVTLTFNPETRSSRGDSYLGNRMEFHLFHSINPDILIEKYGVISEDIKQSDGVPDGLKSYEIDFFPSSNNRKKGCHQKTWKEYKKEPNNRPASPISLVLLNVNKWIYDPNEDKTQKYCISVTFEHEKEIELYNQLKMENQNTLLLRVRN